MSELCKKCSKFQEAKTVYDDSGCTLIYPMQDCPKMKNILMLPNKWRKQVEALPPLIPMPSDREIGYEMCAKELNREIRREC